ncbi:hypothetical protein [Actinomadura miaoliensis]|uniref:Uncharacterized protein n=1 Tax=Actinomadura miaoliensis TaxID=430685 RepID=A0ABP7UZ76_9ACTN
MTSGDQLVQVHDRVRAELVCLGEDVRIHLDDGMRRSGLGRSRGGGADAPPGKTAVSRVLFTPRL